MFSSAVGRLQNQDVGFADEGCLCALDGALRGDANIARDHHLPLGMFQSHAYGPGDVAGQTQGNDQAGDLANRKPIIHRQGHQALQHLLHRLAIVQGQFKLFCGALLHHCDGIGQHNRHQLDAGRSGVDRRTRVHAVQDRQGADMVGVGVSDDDGRHLLSLQKREIRQPLLGQPTHANARVYNQPHVIEP